MTPAEVSAEMRKLADIVETFHAENNPHPPNGEVIFVPEDGDIYDALTSLKGSGGIVELQAGARYPGPIQFPEDPSSIITLRTKGTLPERRIAEEDRPNLATIFAQNVDGCLRLERTSNYTIDGIALEMEYGTHEVAIVEDSDFICFERILSVSPNGLKRIIRGNGRNIVVSRCHLNGGAWQGQDSQAFCCWEGKGPFTIEDNYLAASGENILFGGGDNASEETNPCDIFIARNHIHKPQEWRDKPGSVKNLLELKNATRVQIVENFFDGNWGDAQAGWAIVFTPVNQDGAAPWSIVRDVEFSRNYLTNIEAGINILGQNYGNPTMQSSGFVIRKNVFEVQKKFFQCSGGLQDLIFEDNVVDQSEQGNVVGIYEGNVSGPDGERLEDKAIYDLIWNRNYHRDREWGFHSEVGIGTVSLEARTKTYEFLENKFQGLQFSYPEGTLEISEEEFQAAKASLLKELGY